MAVPALHPLLVQFAQGHPENLIIRVKPDLWMCQDGHFAVRYADDYRFFGPPADEQKRLEHLILFNEKRLEHASTTHGFLYATSNNLECVPGSLDWATHILGPIPTEVDERGLKQTPAILMKYLASVIVSCNLRLRRLRAQFNNLPAVQKMAQLQGHLDRIARNPDSLHKTPEPETQYDWSSSNVK